MGCRFGRYLLIAVTASLISCDRESTSHVSDPPVNRVEPIPEGAQKMRIHWELKLPSMAKCQGDYCVRDRESFAGLLGRWASPAAVARYEKWNGIDFGRQMALVAGEEHNCGGYDVQILGVWKCPSEIVVELLDVVPNPGVTVTLAWTYPWASAVVNRSDLPVRFLRRTRTWAGAELPSR